MNQCKQKKRQKIEKYVKKQQIQRRKISNEHNNAFE